MTRSPTCSDRSLDPPPASTHRPPLAAIVAVLAVALLALAVAPRPPQLSDDTTGDEALAQRVRAIVGRADGRRGLAVAEVTDDRIRTVGVGRAGVGQPVTPTTPFEVGSVTKAMTGMLLANLANHGRVDEGTSVDEVWPDTTFADSTIANATLAQLASHRSGLPRIPRSVRMYTWAALGNLLGINPYAVGAGTPDSLVAASAGASAQRERGAFGYSNLGGALLGQALSQLTGTPYRDLLRDRLLAPLGMDDTTIVSGDQALPPGHAHGHRGNGHPVEAWRNLGYAPAGLGVWSTAADLARLVQATLDGSAPGAAAAEPRFDADGDTRIGYGWLTTDHGTRAITWHDGGTGGFRSWVGFDPVRDHGVVVLSNTQVATERIGLRLLGVPSPDTTPWWETPRAWLPAGALLLAVAAGGRMVWRWRQGRLDGDRIDLLVGASEPAALLLVAGALAPWHHLTLLPWWAGVLAIGAAAWAAGRAWPDAVPLRRRRPWGWAWTGLSLAVDAVILVGYPWLTIAR